MCVPEPKTSLRPLPHNKVDVEGGQKRTQLHAYVPFQAQAFAVPAWDVPDLLLELHGVRRGISRRYTRAGDHRRRWVSISPFCLLRFLLMLFCLERSELWEAWKRWDREKKARKRAERLAFFKECFGDICASLRRTRVLVQCPSRNVGRFDGEVDAHHLHCNSDGDHNGRGKSGSITVRLLSRVVNLRRRGYLKFDVDDNFEEGHTSEDLGWVRL